MLLKKIASLMLFTVTFIHLQSCSNPPQPEKIPTVDGPESTRLLENKKGYIIYDFPVGGMKAWSLVESKELTIRPEDTSQGNVPGGVVHSLAGPDQTGKIVYIENHMKMRKSEHKLKSINIDGSGDEVVFSRDGDALWDDVAGDHLALSPVGGLAALVCNVKKHSDMGTLEIWDTRSRECLEASLPAENSPLCWSQDGKRLFYTGRNTQDKGGGPAIFVYDLEKRKTGFFAPGRSPVVSPDDRGILVQTAGQSLDFIDYDSKAATHLHLRGIIGSPIGFVDNNTILALSLPTTGNPVGLTDNNSPLVGTKAMASIKLYDLPSGEFQTLLPSVDPRTFVAFGRFDPDRNNEIPD